MTGSVHLAGRANAPDFAYGRVRDDDDQSTTDEGGGTASFHSVLRQANSSTTDGTSDQASKSWKKFNGEGSVSSTPGQRRTRGAGSHVTEDSVNSTGTATK